MRKSDSYDQMESYNETNSLSESARKLRTGLATRASEHDDEVGDRKGDEDFGVH